MDTVLGLDIGTSKICLTAVEVLTGKVLKTVSVKNRSDSPTADTLIKEQSPEIVFQQTLDLLKSVTHSLKKNIRIRAIGITGQMHGLLLVNRNGKPLTPFITWQDGRCLKTFPGQKTNYVQEAISRAGADLFRKDCGVFPASGYGGLTLFWMQEHGLIPQEASALTIGDFLALRLSGKTGPIDWTNAAAWGIYDLKRQGWHKEITKALGLPLNLLPEVVNTNNPRRKVVPEISRATGLPAGTCVSRSIGDNQAGFLGAVSDLQNQALINVGTGSQISCPINRFEIYAGVETRPLLTDRYLIVGAGLCGGSAYRYLNDFFADIGKKLFNVQLPEAEIFARMNRLVPAGKPSSSLEVNTRFAGTRINPKTRGSISNIDADNFRAGNLCGGFLEGIVAELNDFYRLFAPDVKVTGLVGSGNAVRKIEPLAGIISKKFKLKVKIPFYTEEAAYGAALNTAVEHGFIGSYREAGRLIKY